MLNLSIPDSDYWEIVSKAEEFVKREYFDSCPEKYEEFDIEAVVDYVVGFVVANLDIDVGR